MTMDQLIGKKVEVYKNLHKDCWSIRLRGKVVHHCRKILIEEPKFVVQPGGRKRALKSGQRNVHAFVRGFVKEIGQEVDELSVELHDLKKVTYRPFAQPFFFEKDSSPELPMPVYRAKSVLCDHPNLFAVLGQYSFRTDEQLPYDDHLFGMWDPMLNMYVGEYLDLDDLPGHR